MSSRKNLFVILAMTPTVALAEPRAWIYLEESEGQVWLLDANDIRPATGWGNEHRPGGMLISTVHIKVSTFPKFNKEMQKRYEGAVQLKITAGWQPFQSVLGGSHHLDDPKRIAYVELLADTNFPDIGNPANHEWVAVDCSTGDVGVTEASQSESAPTYHASTGTYLGSTSISTNSKWVASLSVPSKYHPLVAFVCNPNMRKIEGVPSPTP